MAIDFFLPDGTRQQSKTIIYFLSEVEDMGGQEDHLHRRSKRNIHTKNHFDLQQQERKGKVYYDVNNHKKKTMMEPQQQDHHLRCCGSNTSIDTMTTTITKKKHHHNKNHQRGGGGGNNSFAGLIFRSFNYSDKGFALSSFFILGIVMYILVTVIALAIHYDYQSSAGTLSSNHHHRHHRHLIGGGLDPDTSLPAPPPPPQQVRRDLSKLAASLPNQRRNMRKVTTQEDSNSAAAAASTPTTMDTVKVIDGSRHGQQQQLRTLDNMDESPYYGSSQCPTGNDNSNNDDIQTTLALQTTLDRFWLLKEHCNRWRTDPIVVVVSIKPNEINTDNYKEVFLGSTTSNSWNRDYYCPQHKQNQQVVTIIKYMLSETQSQPDQLPINVLRNIALDSVRTSHVLTADIDFIPSQNLDMTILNTLQQNQQQQELEALVVPAFERLVRPPCDNSNKKDINNKDCYDRCKMGEECSKKNFLERDSTFIPKSFQDLRQCVLEQKKCIVFQQDIKGSGHSSTRSQQWLNGEWYDDGDKSEEDGVRDNPHRSIQKIKCLLSDQYEPYVVVRWCNNSGAATGNNDSDSSFEMTKTTTTTNNNDNNKPIAPYFDERFIGYGKNKIQYTSHIRLMGYSFAVLPEGFLVHNPHTTSNTKKAWRDRKTYALRSKMDQLYPKFLKGLGRKYASTIEDIKAIVPACRSLKKAQRPALPLNKKKKEKPAATSKDDERSRNRLVKDTPKSNSEGDGELNTITKNVTVTDTGIDVSDPELYGTVNLNGNSSSATVIGMATNYDLVTHQRFIGSLRKSGYSGNILLLVESSISSEIQQYFKARNVTYRKVEMLSSTSCVNAKHHKGLNSEIKNENCLKEYPELKARWGRYPLLRDFLKDCEACTGPVLYVDVRDAFFQRDPFGPGSPPIRGLQVYQEHQDHTTKHWFVARPMLQCKNVQYDEPNLCSGSTVGTRPAMVKYLDIMYEEIKVWINTPKCTFSDQSVHNYIYYSKQLPFATSIKNQGGGIVNTVFHSARAIVEEHASKMMKLHPDQIPKKPKQLRLKKALSFPFDGADGNNGTRWIAKKYNLIDDEGYFVEFDGGRSRVVHKFDRFGGVGSHFYNAWLGKQSWLTDSMAETTTAAAKS